MSVEEWIAARVAEAPPLTPDQRARLVALLRPATATARPVRQRTDRALAA